MLLLPKISFLHTVRLGRVQCLGMGAEGNSWKLHNQSWVVHTVILYAICIAAETWPILSIIGPVVFCHVWCSVFGKRTHVLVATLRRRSSE